MSVLLFALVLLAQDPAPVVAPAPSSQENMAVVTLNCALQPTGSLDDCRVVRETPAGQGYGDAALQTSRRMRVPLRDGLTEHPASRVQYDTKFRLDPLDVVIALPDRR